MEYLGRLGLVPRKSKKDRERSPQKRRCGEESRSLKTDFTRAVESNLISKKVSGLPSTRINHSRHSQGSHANSNDNNRVIKHPSRAALRISIPRRRSIAR